MSREISQINDYDGVFKDRFEERDLRVEVQPLCNKAADTI